ncbi:STAS/SEC14 domain-containing protein [Pontibacter akesuensis]|uniref:SpoIIAA-like n=1 Tax=Pontibacter akesuensis TaxID=388950 RepID=A0A1I7JN84_9BACT|nr:STAS/SEC14 domain-containing protein [Pontibacter akesuensis]GHA68753.1 hypothetical protein GCM10007389_22210 [Pontibacter akesuensis]SFU86600.1 SpoIIAA-like [Pontibacter akesuensis]
MLKEVKSVFGKTFYRIEYKDDLNVVEATWQGTASKQDLRNAIIAGLEVHENTKCAFRLNDNTEFTGPWADSVKWIEEEWLPRAYKSGIRYLAHVARPNSFGEAAGEAMLLGKIGAAIEVKLFDNREDALQWLKKKQEADDASKFSIDSTTGNPA